MDISREKLLHPRPLPVDMNWIKMQSCMDIVSLHQSQGPVKGRLQRAGGMDQGNLEHI